MSLFSCAEPMRHFKSVKANPSNRALPKACRENIAFAGLEESSNVAQAGEADFIRRTFRPSSAVPVVVWD